MNKSNQKIVNYRFRRFKLLHDVDAFYEFTFSSIELKML